MRIGKVSDSVLKRSVLKLLRGKKKEILKGAGVGEDCALFSCSDAHFASCVSEAAVADVADIGRALQKCANNLATAKAEPVAAMMQLLLPEDFEEPTLKQLMKGANEAAEALSLQIMGGHTTVSPYVTKPMVCFTGFGKAIEGQCIPTQGIKPGMDIIVTKWIGLEGTAILAKNHEEELLGRYPQYMVEEAIAFSKYQSILPEAAVAWKSGASSMHDVSEGGVFAALWEMAESAGVGLNIDLRKLPLRQETVEVCELLEKNPYELLGGGSLLIATADGDAMVEALEAEGIHATNVGQFTGSNDKLIFNEDEKRYMDRPAMDQVYEN